MSTEKQMLPLLEVNGKKFYYADDSFVNPGIYYFDGTNNVNVSEKMAEQTAYVDLYTRRLAYIKDQCDGGDGTVDALALEKFMNLIDGICVGHLDHLI